MAFDFLWLIWSCFPFPRTYDGAGTQDGGSSRVVGRQEGSTPEEKEEREETNRKKITNSFLELFFNLSIYVSKYTKI